VCTGLLPARAWFKNCITKKKPIKSNQVSLTSYLKAAPSKSNTTADFQASYADDKQSNQSTSLTLEAGRTDDENTTCTDMKESADISQVCPIPFSCSIEIGVGNNNLLCCNKDQCSFESKPEQCGTKQLKVDWSYTTRKQMQKLRPDKSQLKITDYYAIVEKLDILADTNLYLVKLLNAVKAERNNALSMYNHSDCEEFGSFFKQLLKNAESNTSKLLNQRRHDEIIKKFATPLLLYAGPMAYNFIHSDMPIALPSLRTVQRALHADYRMLSEGEFRFNELANHLTRQDIMPLN